MGNACSCSDDGSGRPLEPARRGSRFHQHRAPPRGLSRKSLSKSQRSLRRSDGPAAAAQEEFSALSPPPAPVRLHGVTAGATGACDSDVVPSAFAESPQQHHSPVVVATSSSDAKVAALKKFTAPTRPSDNVVCAPAAAVADSDDLTGDLASLSLAATGPSVACRIGGGRAATNISAVLQGDDADGRRSAFSDATTTGGGGSRRTSLASRAATPNPLRPQ